MNIVLNSNVGKVKFNGNEVDKVKFNGAVVWSKPAAQHIYGVSVTNGTFTRTDDAANFSDPVPYYKNMSGSPSSPFDNIMPWSGMVKETDSLGNVMVKIPKFYYKITGNDSSSGISIQIADTQIDNTWKVSPAHRARSGWSEKEYVYIGRYACASDYKSKTGVAPKTSITRSTAKNGCRGIGTGYYEFDISLLATIQLLFVVEFASWDSQGKIGLGNPNSKQNNGLTDSMSYHTGCTEGKTEYKGGVQYRWIENLWCNVKHWCDGITYHTSGSQQSSYYFDNFANYSTTYNGTGAVAITNGSYNTTYKSGYLQTAGIATTSNGGFIYLCNKLTSTTESYGYFGKDKVDASQSGDSLVIGGSYNSQSTDFGLFYRNIRYGTADASYIGCRLQYIP